VALLRNAALEDPPQQIQHHQNQDDDDEDRNDGQGALPSDFPIWLANVLFAPPHYPHDPILETRGARLPLPAVSYVEVRLLNGDVFTVEGTLDEVESKLSDAARSGQSRLAWFKEQGTDGSVGVNPAHVVTLKPSEISG
jgi:hypothetical protein